MVRISNVIWIPDKVVRKSNGQSSERPSVSRLPVRKSNGKWSIIRFPDRKSSHRALFGQIFRYSNGLAIRCSDKILSGKVAIRLPDGPVFKCWLYLYLVSDSPMVYSIPLRIWSPLIEPLQGSSCSSRVNTWYETNITPHMFTITMFHCIIRKIIIKRAPSLVPA